MAEVAGLGLQGPRRLRHQLVELVDREARGRSALKETFEHSLPRGGRPQGGDARPRVEQELLCRHVLGHREQRVLWKLVESEPVQHERSRPCDRLQGSPPQRGVREDRPGAVVVDAGEHVVSARRHEDGAVQRPPPARARHAGLQLDAFRLQLLPQEATSGIVAGVRAYRGRSQPQARRGDENVALRCVAVRQSPPTHPASWPRLDCTTHRAAELHVPGALHPVHERRRQPRRLACRLVRQRWHRQLDVDAQVAERTHVPAGRPRGRPGPGPALPVGEPPARCSTPAPQLPGGRRHPGRAAPPERDPPSPPHEGLAKVVGLPAAARRPRK